MRRDVRKRSVKVCKGMDDSSVKVNAYKSKILEANVIAKC